MEFKDKIQKLRNANGLTQEQLAEKLFISRTAVSKWERGKGYPNIDTLKDIAKLFNVKIDELISSHEIIDIAKKENISNIKKTNNLIYGMLDIISVLFVVLPLYAKKTNEFIYSVSLINANDINDNIKKLYIIIFIILTIIGILEIIFNFIDNKKTQKIVNFVSLIFEIILVFLFAITRQAYLTAITFTILVIKVVLIFRGIENKKTYFDKGTKSVSEKNSM